MNWIKQLSWYSMKLIMQLSIRIISVLFKEGRIAKYGTVEEVITKEVLSEIYQVDFEILNIQGKPLSIYY